MYEYNHIFPIVKMSQVLGVSRSGYYRWRDHPVSTHAMENRRLTKKIKQVWLDSGKTYGSPRIHAVLTAQGETASRSRVARLMRKAGIASQLRRKWVTTTDSKHSLPIGENLLDRDFNPARLARVWVSDITYIASRHGWLYLTTVMDLADRQIIGWSLADNMTAESTSIAAWQAAHAQRPIIDLELIFHSDRGVQYAWAAFTNLLKANPLITQSMSRKGNCWDNAPAESFFKTFKTELPIETKNYNYRQIRQATFEFIEIWYNRKRLHSSLDYRTPAEHEQLLTQKQQLAA